MLARKPHPPPPTPVVTLRAAGVCPDGPNCKFGHPKFEIPMPPRDAQQKGVGGMGGGGMRDLSMVTCYKCYQKGHYANACPNAPAMGPTGGGGGMGGGGMGGEMACGMGMGMGGTQQGGMQQW